MSYQLIETIDCYINSPYLDKALVPRLQNIKEFLQEGAQDIDGSAAVYQRIADQVMHLTSSARELEIQAHIAGEDTAHHHSDSGTHVWDKSAHDLLEGDSEAQKAATLAASSETAWGDAPDEKVLLQMTWDALSHPSLSAKARQPLTDIRRFLETQDISESPNRQAKIHVLLRQLTAHLGDPRQKSA